MEQHNEKENSMHKLLVIANQTKSALMAQWEADCLFKDKNNLKKKGVLPEGIGLTSLLLLLVAFRDEEQVFTADDKSRAGRIINASLSQLCEWSADHFGAVPLLNPRNASLFNSQFGYMDTVVWSLSASILARYCYRKGALALEEDIQEKTLSLMARALSALLDAQQETGTWGFATDKASTKSLYFTYQAASALADFFDYILGEIEEVEESACSVDEDALIYLDKTLGNTSQRVNTARERLQVFLIQDCLPLLPQIANCENLSQEKMQRIGMTKPVTDDGNNYHNLYYAYYLLDMMITSSVDQRYNALTADPAQAKQLQKYYTDNGLLSKNEQEYHFKNDNFALLFTSYYEQALHASRLQYIYAARTGSRFMDSVKSELPILWLHQDAAKTAQAEQALEQSKAIVTDPTLISMALRANTVYSYYVTEKPDITVERLFENIRQNRSICDGEVDGEEYEESLVEFLWDSLYYSLPITERSIESIIDYYDYLCKFEIHTENQAAVAEKSPMKEKIVVAEKSALEVAVEEKIEAYLTSNQGKQLLTSVISQAAPAPADVSAADPLADAVLTQWLQKLSADISNYNPYAVNTNARDELADALLQLSDQVGMICAEKQLLRNTPELEDPCQKDLDKAKEDLNKMLLYFWQFLARYRMDLNYPQCRPRALYESVRPMTE